MGNEDKYNIGDWTTLDTIEIGDTIGGIKILDEFERDYFHALDAIIRKGRIELPMRLYNPKMVGPPVKFIPDEEFDKKYIIVEVSHGEKET